MCMFIVRVGYIKADEFTLHTNLNTNLDATVFFIAYLTFSKKS